MVDLRAVFVPARFEIGQALEIYVHDQCLWVMETIGCCRPSTRTIFVGQWKTGIMPERNPALMKRRR